MPDFCDKDEQLVLCFVTLNMQIVFFRMMMQPEGGFFPLIVLTKNGMLNMKIFLFGICLEFTLLRNSWWYSFKWHSSEKNNIVADH